MHILIAPDSFKGTLTAIDACAAMARGVARARPEATVRTCPLADGGEGTAETLVGAADGRWVEARVSGPLGSPVSARYGLFEDVAGRPCAAIDLAAAAGLPLVDSGRRDPTTTSTFGVGQLIRDALSHPIDRLLLGLGGSATCDAGAGMAQALGARFVGTDALPLTGGTLSGVEGVDLDGLDHRLAQVDLIGLTDVSNPLTGAEGAAAVYGPQKGATPRQVFELERALSHVASLLGCDALTSGFGAAGGAGFGVVAFLGGRLAPGLDLVIDAVGFDAMLRDADLLLTGEGRLDPQSLSGKVVGGVTRRAAEAGVPAIALVGQDALSSSSSPPSFAVHSLVKAGESVAAARADAADLLEATTAAALREHLRR